MALKSPFTLVNHSARKAWESYLACEQTRLLPEFQNSFGSKLLDPCEITDNDVRLEFRFVQQPIGTQDKNTTSCTPWRMCQMLAAKDETESEVEMDSDAFNVVTSDDYGRNSRGETLKQVGDSLQHRCPLLGLHHRTTLRTTRVRCRIRTALVPMERPEKWRTEVRCVFRHAPTRDANQRLAFLLASELGIALDLGRPETEHQPLQMAFLADGGAGEQTLHCFPFDVTARFESAPPPSPTSAEAVLGPDCTANDVCDCVAWHVTVPTQDAPPPSDCTSRPPPRASKTDDTDSEPDDSDDDELPPVKRQRSARPVVGMITRGRCSGFFEPLPIRQFSAACLHDGSPKAPVATALRIARIRANEDLSPAALQIAARAQAAAYANLHMGGSAPVSSAEAC